MFIQDRMTFEVEQKGERKESIAAAEEELRASQGLTRLTIANKVPGNKHD